jgi:hypothetical protein
MSDVLRRGDGSGKTPRRRGSRSTIHGRSRTPGRGDVRAHPVPLTDPSGIGRRAGFAPASWQAIY